VNREDLRRDPHVFAAVFGDVEAASPAMPALPASLDVEPGDAAHGAERGPAAL